MANILVDIFEQRKIQLENEKSELSEEMLAAQLQKCSFDTGGVFADALINRKIGSSGVALIAEIKKASPSKSVIREDFNAAGIAKEYQNAQVSAISVLTEEKYFLGSGRYLSDTHDVVGDAASGALGGIPLLRKDFIFCEYQLDSAKVLGASAVLLIAAMLSEQSFAALYSHARAVGLDVLAEVHNEAELYKILPARPTVVGINNRDLTTFKVDLSVTDRLARRIRENLPSETIIVSESGITARDDIKRVRDAGADAVLVGETLMRSDNIAAAVSELFGD